MNQMYRNKHTDHVVLVKDSTLVSGHTVFIYEKVGLWVNGEVVLHPLKDQKEHRWEFRDFLNHHESVKHPDTGEEEEGQ